MTEAALQFEDGDRVGRVAAVDTGHVLVDAEDPALVTRLRVGDLVAVRGATEQEYLIGIIGRVTRSVREDILDVESDDLDELQVGPSPADLVRAVVVGTYRTVQGDRTNVFKRGADTFPQIDRECYLIAGANLQRLMGLLGEGLEQHERLQLGHFVLDPTALAIASGDRFFQRHACLLGSTGSGKSWAVALMLERASKLAHPNLIVLDMHGEYAPLADAEGGFAKRYRIAGPGELTYAGEDVIFLPFWMLNREEMLSMILDRSDQNAPNQASRFTTHVRALKEATLVAEGMEATKETFTVDSPIPYSLDDLLALVRHDDTERVAGSTAAGKKGDWNGKLTRFIGRLEAKKEDRRYGFMFQPPEAVSVYGWLAGVLQRLLGSSEGTPGIKIVDFSEVPSDVLPVVAGTFARLLYDVQSWMRAEKRTPFTIVCDEAHLYLPVKDQASSVETQALAAFERIAKEGRKYGASLLVVSQRPADVSRTILSQCNNFLVLRLTNDRDQGVVKRLVPDSMSGLTDVLPLLDTGEALILGDSVLLPTRVRLDKPTIEPDSSTRAFWTEWGSLAPDEAAVAEAVETLRRQTRPE